VRALNRRFLRLDCDVRNAKLCTYYESLGFVRVGIKQVPEDGDYIASLHDKSADFDKSYVPGFVAVRERWRPNGCISNTAYAASE
jgi:hypothetical protein